MLIITTPVTSSCTLDAHSFPFCLFHFLAYVLLFLSFLALLLHQNGYKEREREREKKLTNCSSFDSLVFLSFASLPIRSQYTLPNCVYYCIVVCVTEERSRGEREKEKEKVRTEYASLKHETSVQRPGQHRLLLLPLSHSPSQKKLIEESFSFSTLRSFSLLSLFWVEAHTTKLATKTHRESGARHESITCISAPGQVNGRGVKSEAILL